MGEIYNPMSQIDYLGIAIGFHYQKFNNYKSSLDWFNRTFAGSQTPSRSKLLELVCQAREPFQF